MVQLRCGFLLLVVTGLAMGRAGGVAPGQGGTSSGLGKAAVGEAKPKKLAFEVVSVRTGEPDRKRFMMQWGLPDRFRAQGMPVESIVALAYFGPVKAMAAARSEKLVSGLPDWTEKVALDVEGTVPPEDVEAYQKQGPDKPMLQQMLQSMLEERFGIVARREMVDGPVYVLEVGKKGAQLKANKEDEPKPLGGMKLANGGWVIPFSRNEEPRMRFVSVTMTELTQFLSNSADRPVVDRTELTGRYDFALLRRDLGEAGDPEPSVVWNVEEIGLRVVATTAPRERLVVEKLEKPTVN